MRTMNISLSALALTSVISGCAAPAPPAELVCARSEYENALRGPAPLFASDELRTARETLDRAEHSFQENGGAQRTRDLAYTAERAAQTAQARGRARWVLDQRNRTIAQPQTIVSTMERVSTALDRAAEEAAGGGAPAQVDPKASDDTLAPFGPTLPRPGPK